MSDEKKRAILDAFMRSSNPTQRKIWNPQDPARMVQPLRQSLDYTSMARHTFPVGELSSLKSPVEYTWEGLRSRIMWGVEDPERVDLTNYPVRMAERRFHAKYPGIANGLIMTHPHQMDLRQMQTRWKWCYKNQIDLEHVTLLEYKGSEAALIHVLEDMTHVESLTLRLPYFGSALCERILTTLPKLQELKFWYHTLQGDIGISQLAAASTSIPFTVRFESPAVKSPHQTELLRRVGFLA